MPTGTIGFRLAGELTDGDYAEVLAPAMRGAAAAGGGRLMVVAAKGFDLGSLKSPVESARPAPALALGHRKDWRRVAIVAEINFLLRRSFPVWSRVIPVEMKLFGLDDEADARSWVAAS